jgi:hypothetical protein
MEGKQGSGSRNLVHLCPHGWRVKNRSLVDRRVSAPKRDASTLPRHRNAWLPSCRSAMRDQPQSPIRDVAAALLLLYRPKRLCQPRSDRGVLIHPPMIARYALGPEKIRMFRSSKLVATLAVLLCFSFAGQAETIQHRSREPTGAGHHYIVQPRSSRVTTRGRPRTGHVPSGGAGHSYAHSTFSQPTPIHGTFAAPRWW